MTQKPLAKVMGKSRKTFTNQRLRLDLKNFLGFGGGRNKKEEPFY